MIVYGTRTTRQKTESLFEPCPNCRTTNSLQLSVFQKYAHVFWIPLFPLKKIGISVCSNCRQVLKQDQMPASLRLSYDNLKAQTKIPIWNFTGIFLIIAGIIAIVISQKQTAEKVGKYILHPKKDDIFEIKIKDDAFTLYKVEKVVQDSVYFFANKYQTDQESGLGDLANKGDKGFDTDSVYILSKTTLIDMNKKDEIIDIDRK
jgi:hypothetical protein